MVARVNFSKSIRNVVGYNEKKVKAAQAKLLFASGFGAAAAQIAPRSKLEVFRKLTRQNVRSRTNVMHVSLNFLQEDQLSAGKMMQIAGDYMRGIGFGRQPYLVYQHFDSGHPHLHLVSVIIQDGGRRIATHNLAYEASKIVAREIDQHYGLLSMNKRENGQPIAPEIVPLRLVRYGEMATWRALSSIVDQVVKGYKYHSLPQLNAVLNQFGVMADGGRPGSRLRENGGLVYYLLDEKGKRVGRAIKASELYGQPTLKYLRGRFLYNSIGHGTYRIRLKYHLDRLLEEVPGQQDMETVLRRQGIRLVFNKDPAGHVFGVTFIDNGARAVFTDRELGEKYHYTLFLKWAAGFEKKDQMSLRRSGLSVAIPDSRELSGDPDQARGEITVPDSLDTPAGRAHPGSELPAFEIRSDVLYYDYDDEDWSHRNRQGLDRHRNTAFKKRQARERWLHR